MAVAPHRANLARGDFGDTTIAVPTAARHSVEISGFAPVEIMFKPRPAYTEEARRVQIEGEVLLEMLFSASGEVRFVRLVRGLGRGWMKAPSPRRARSASARRNAKGVQWIPRPSSTSYFNLPIKRTLWKEHRNETFISCHSVDSPAHGGRETGCCGGSAARPHRRA